MTAPAALNTPPPGTTFVQTPPQGDNSQAAINSQFLNLALDGLAAGTASSTVTGPDAFGAGAPAGSASTFSRGDHHHGLPASGKLTELGINATAPSVAGSVASVPPASATIQTALGNLALGSAFHNTLSYDVQLTVYLAVTANTSLVLEDGVGTTTTPTQTTIITGTTATGVIPVRAKVPAGQYRLLSATGTYTGAITGQYLEAA